MTHAAARHRHLDRACLRALGDPDHAHALLASRARMKDLRTMNGPPQAKMLLATLTEHTSARGNAYLRGWAGASNLAGFRGGDDDEGRPINRQHAAPGIFPMPMPSRASAAS
jgi:hypothetical protein